MACGHLREFGMRYKSWPSFLFLSRWVGQEGQQEGILHRDLWRKLARQDMSVRAWRQGERPGGDTVGDRKESLVLERITVLGDGHLDLALPVCEDEGTATQELTAFSLVHG